MTTGHAQGGGGWMPLYYGVLEATWSLVASQQVAGERRPLKRMAKQKCRRRPTATPSGWK